MNSNLSVLVTGGAGYVGSHAVRSLLAAGHRVVVLDNLSAGHAKAVTSPARLVVGEVGDERLLNDLFTEFRFDAVMHFAAFIEVGESVVDPLRFYDNNAGNTFRLLKSMQKHGIKRFVFSSTCATYGTPERMPITEDTPQRPESPYARAKLAVEWALSDSAAAWQLGFVALRYFNAAGASADATIGEDHSPESHLIPNVLKVALGQRKHLTVYGTDYPTKDGTCVRDYIHVDDLADAHVKALEIVKPGEQRFYNAGTGRGTTVREIVETARRITGHPIPVVESNRRPGDVPVLCADPRRIMADLGWSPRFTDLRDIVASAWAWHSRHPHGFDDRRKERTGEPSA